MNTKLIEATNGPQNWGKFLIGRYDQPELNAISVVDARPLVRSRGWTDKHAWVCDLQTGEGACFLLGGHAKADLDKHRIWVCPLFEPFLTWLYIRANAMDPDTFWETMPVHVDLPQAPFELRGYRREGA